MMNRTQSYNDPSKVGLGEMVGYGFSNTAVSLVWTSIGGFLTYFYTDVFGLSLAAMSMILLFSRVWDMVADFLMGILADRTKTRWGKFRPWLLWGCVPFAVITFLTFSVPALGMTGKVIYAFVTYILLMTIYTICAVPQNAIQGVMSDDPDVRTKITSVGGFFGQVGGFVATACTLPLVKYFGHGNEALGFQWTVGLFGLILVVLLLAAFFSVKERVQPPVGQHSSVLIDVKDLLGNRPWVLVFTVGVIAALGAASRYGVAVHFYKYNMGDKDLTTLFRSIGVVAAMLGALSTPVAGRLLGKSRALGVCVLLVGVSSMLMHFASPQRIWIAYSSTIICEFFGGVVITMFFAMLGDTADFNEWKHGRRATGIIYAAGSIALKTGFAFGGLIMAGVLGYYGYQANVEQSARGLFGISMAANVVPGILYCLAAIPMFFYPLTTAKLEEIKLDLERRRGVISAG